jgi:hypothetical protein
MTMQEGQGKSAIDAKNVAPLPANRSKKAALETISKKPALRVAAPVANAISKNKTREESSHEAVSDNNAVRSTTTTEVKKPVTTTPEQPFAPITTATLEEIAANEGEKDSKDKAPTEIVTEDLSSEEAPSEGCSSMVETVSGMLRKVSTGESTAEPALELSLNYCNVHDDDPEQDDIEIERNPTEDNNCQHGADDAMEDLETGVDPVDSFKHSQNTDPFEVREGRTLLWKNVNMTLVRTVK